MIKAKMILADSDEMYLNSLSDYFIEHAPQFELSIFSQEDKLLKYLKNGGSADIFVVDEAMATQELCLLAKDATKIALSALMPEPEGYAAIKKYQKSQALVNNILLRHAENTGKTEALVGKSHTQVAAFYSPAGGTGKTVLSLATATAAANMGLRVLYLNLEEIDSVGGVLGRTAGSLSEVYLALKTRGMNAGVKLAAGVGQAQGGGFYYLSGVDSVSEYEEVDGTDIMKLIETVKALADFDLAILDLSSGFDEKTKKTLECADAIFVPVVSEAGSIEKMKRFLAEAERHRMYDSIFKKMNLVINKAALAGGTGELGASGIMNEIPCCAAVAASPVFERYGSVVSAGEALRPSMEPIVQAAVKK